MDLAKDPAPRNVVNLAKDPAIAGIVFRSTKSDSGKLFVRNVEIVWQKSTRGGAHGRGMPVVF